MDLQDEREARSARASSASRALKSPVSLGDVQHHQRKSPAGRTLTFYQRGHLATSGAALGLIALGCFPSHAQGTPPQGSKRAPYDLPTALQPAMERVTATQESAGQIRWDRGERRAAVAELEDWLQQHPDAHSDWLRLAGWRSSIRRHAGALDALERLPADLAEASEARRLRGEALFALDRLDEALAFLDPERRDHARYRIESLESLGRLEALERELSAAEKRYGPEQADFLVARGQLALRAGDPAKARGAFERALALDDLELRALFGLGTALVRTGKRERGLELLQKHRALLPLLDRVHFARESLALAPNHAPNHAALAEAWRDLGRLDAAEASFRDALAWVTPKEAVPVGLRWARFLEEQRESPRAAVSHLDMLFKNVPNDPRLPVRAGDILARLGDHPEAAKRFRAALELRPGDAQIEARLAKVL